MRVLLIFVCLIPGVLVAQEMDHSGHNMAVDMSGTVMNENRDTLPEGCGAISGDQSFTIHAGMNYADQTRGMTFGMSQNEVVVEPCSRVQITFVNEDDVRHQWMVHGLPKYLYPTGMFHIEAMGGRTQTGVFIVPPENQNYLIHCDMAQHMEKGMRGQLVVGSGSGNLWGVPGISDAFYRYSYQGELTSIVALAIALGGFLASLFLTARRK